MKVKTICLTCGFKWQQVELNKKTIDGFINLFNGTIQELQKTKYIDKNIKYFDIEKDDNCTLTLYI